VAWSPLEQPRTASKEPIVLHRPSPSADPGTPWLSSSYPILLALLMSTACSAAAGPGAVGSGGGSGADSTGARSGAVANGSGGAGVAGGPGSGTTNGSGGGGGTGAVAVPGSGGAPVSASLPGVVVADPAARCAPLCRVHLDPAADPEKDDWSYEDGQSCVIPTTATSKNQGCITGEPLPPPPSVPGVVVVDLGMTRCAPLCTLTTSLASDADGDGWSYENNSSCVIPGTITASNQACMTAKPLPPPESRPGIKVDTNGDAVAECVPVCRVATKATDATAPDWGYENNGSCVLPTSPTAAGKLACTVNGTPPSFKPPALMGAKVKDGFYVQNGKLLDAYGNPFVIRGVNNAHIYFDPGARYLAWQALDNIGVYGTNTIRVVWDTTGSAALLAEVLARVVELKMIPMVELHDVTGNQDSARLLDMARYYTTADVKQVLTDFRAYLLINIANEWSGQGNYATAYQAAISLMRASGINHTLVIDGSGFGQDASSIFSNATALTTADPQHNLLFSLHMYDRFPTVSAVDAALNQASASSIPLVVGEFGNQLGGTSVAWQEIMARCQSLGLGYIAWSWMGNDGTTALLNMARDWEGPLTTWGQDVLTGTNGIQQTAHRAGIF
jgi:hypothetical protein